MNSLDPISSGIKSVTSVDDFESKYTIKLDRAILQIVDRSTNLALATLHIKEHECLGYNPSHFYEGNYYFALSSRQYKAKYIYHFSLQDKSLKCVFAPSNDPRFFESRFIEFGAGFNTPGFQNTDITLRTGEGAIRVYDLTKQPFNLTQHIIVKNGGGYGWDGDIDEEKKEITAFDHVKGTVLRYPIFNKV